MSDESSKEEIKTIERKLRRREMMTKLNSWMGFSGKTLWNCLELLVIPAFLVLAVVWFNFSQNLRDQKIAEIQYREEILRDYLNGMEVLILENDLMEEKGVENSPLIDVAHVKTITALRNLDVDRKNIIFQFLRDSGLSDFLFTNATLSGIDLSGADLSEMNFSETHLFEVDLHGAQLSSSNLSNAEAWGVNLSDAFMAEANLNEISLFDGDLSGAVIIGSDLSRANLAQTNLSWINLWGSNLSHANLIFADLTNADLPEVNLSNADLSNADLSNTRFWMAILDNANLTGAVVTDEQLAEAESLEGAIMPDGTLYDGRFDE